MTLALDTLLLALVLWRLERATQGVTPMCPSGTPLPGATIVPTAARAARHPDYLRLDRAHVRRARARAGHAGPGARGIR